MRALAGWSVRHRRLVVAGWLVALIGLVAVSQSVGSNYKDSLSLKGTQSFQAQTLLNRVAPKASGDREQIVVAVRKGKLTDPAVRRQVEAMLAKVSALPYVASVATPYGAAGSAQTSRSGQIAFANVTLTKQGDKITKAQATQLVNTVKTVAGNGVQVGLEGRVASAANRTSVSTVGFGAFAALIVLLLVFGSLLAATLPLLTAGVALGSAVGVIALLSHVLDIASFSSELSLLIGLGVGVDYALFIVTRFRQGLQRGLPTERAIIDALDTSGRAVMFAGVTVCIALLGMFALGVSFLYGVAISASIAVLFTVISALTLLPAMLGFLGTRVLGRKARRKIAAGERTVSDESPAWNRWAHTLRQRPALFAAAATGLMLVIAIPFVSMRLGSADAGSDTAGSPTRIAYDLLAKGFGPGYNGPLQLVAQINNPAQQAAFKNVTTAVDATSGVVRVTEPRLITGQAGQPGVATADVYPTGSPQDASTTRLLHQLRNEVVPASTSNGLQRPDRWSDRHLRRLRWRAQQQTPVVHRRRRAPLIPPPHSGLPQPAHPGHGGADEPPHRRRSVRPDHSRLPVGLGQNLLGLTKTGPIEPFIPVMMFAIVFGLSMDYQVFLVSRIYEEWHRRGDNREAVTHGLAATGKTITAAAAIMVLVFGSFMLGGERLIALFGLGLAGAVLLDALIIRSVLVPALMLLAGKANWWLPRSLDRILPHLNIEGGIQHDDDRPRPTPTLRPAPRTLLEDTVA